MSGARIVWWMARVDKIVAANPHITVAELARELAVSRQHLAALFRAHHGTGLRRHLLARSMAAVAQLLRDGSLSMKEIAGICGYAHEPALNRAFTRIYASRRRPIASARWILPKRLMIF
jgi:transcriptional regulator GlxA family with amidase domain